MEKQKDPVLEQQVEKIGEVLSVLKTQYVEDYPDEINFLEIVKSALSENA